LTYVLVSELDLETSEGRPYSNSIAHVTSPSTSQVIAVGGANDVLVRHLLQGARSSLDEQMTDVRGLPSSMNLVNVRRTYVGGQYPSACSRRKVDLQGTVRAGQAFIHRP
jgi:hypothetical protein